MAEGMPNLRAAIQAFRDTRAKVYRTDAKQIVRDNNAARRCQKDHAGRWFFELLQNCEDAEATAVEVRVTDEAVYLADNGRGFHPEAVASISGTDFSDKPTGTIGRKGVGFKAVYEVTPRPQVFALNGEGLEFDHRRAVNWFREQEIPCDEDDVPYQWVPFFVSRKEAEGEDPVLRELHEFNTVIRLPLKSKNSYEAACGHLSAWPSHALLPFRHITTLRVVGTAVSFQIRITRDVCPWILRDSRTDGETKWRVLTKPVSTPDKFLAELDRDDRKRAQNVSFLVAAPAGPAGAVTPASDFLPLHVFYPTEEPSPVRLLLHGEFLVKTDRTAIIPIAESPFNSWASRVLAELVVKFVNESYDPCLPASSFRLLLPMGSLEKLPVADNLWQEILTRANAGLLLPDLNGNRVLPLDKARILTATVEPELARKILASTPIGDCLLHKAVDEDPEAHQSLSKLGCQCLSDEDVLEAIKLHAQDNAQNHEWIWASLCWVAAWAADRPWGDEHKERLSRIKGLPLLAVGRTIESPVSLEDCIVTWRGTEAYTRLPAWMPIRFLEDWLRDHILGLPQEALVLRLLDELGIKAPAEDVFLKAFGRAVTTYWKSPEGDPGRFIEFLLNEDWHETLDSTPEVQRCPVLADIERGTSSQWVEAREAYFGRAWGESLIADIYVGVEGVAWAQKPERDTEVYRTVLAWLGVQAFPRVVRDLSKQAVESERSRVCPLVSYDYVIEAPCLRLSHLDDITRLSVGQSVALVCLLARHWGGYYAQQSQVWITHTPRTRHYRTSVPARWWQEVKRGLLPPMVAEKHQEDVSLEEGWLPDKATRKAVGELMPIIDLHAFGADAEEAGKWLREVVRVRTSLIQIPPDEWRELLSRRIPAIVSSERAAASPTLRDRVVRWYEACLDSLEQQDGVPDRAMARVPILCRKGEEWAYRADEPIWLADDDDIANAFRGDSWQADLASSRRSEAKRLFGLWSLSENTEVELMPGPLVQEKGDALQRALVEVSPYVFVWRCSQTKEDPDTVRAELLSMGVAVVDGLQACLRLQGVGDRIIDKPWGVAKKDRDGKRQLLISAEYLDSNLILLGQAMAEALRVRTDADFYANLLRCGSDAERKDMLLFKGVTKDEADRLLRLFRQEAEGEDAAEAKAPVEAERGSESKQAPIQETQKKLPVLQARGPGGQQDEAAEPKISGRDGANGGAEEVLALKDPEIAEIVFCAALRIQAGDTTVHQPSGGGESQGGGSQLTQEEKERIEDAGRAAAARELKRMGYAVTQMPRKNRGFDIKATKDDAELRVEVKAHRRSASVVEITVAEVEEYSKQQGNESVRWELWNVENLSSGASGSITITRYDQIPDEALREHLLILDLRKCKPISS